MFNKGTNCFNCRSPTCEKTLKQSSRTSWGRELPKHLNVHPQLLIYGSKVLEKCPEMSESYIYVLSTAHFSHTAHTYMLRVESAMETFARINSKMQTTISQINLASKGSSHLHPAITFQSNFLHQIGPLHTLSIFLIFTKLCLIKQMLFSYFFDFV